MKQTTKVANTTKKAVVIKGAKADPKKAQAAPKKVPTPTAPVKKAAPKAEAAPSIQTLTSKEAEALHFITGEMAGHRKSEPGYSFIGATDIKKHFGWNPKTVSDTVNGLIAKEFLTDDAENKVLNINWKNIPAKLDVLRELITEEKVEEKPAPKKGSKTEKEPEAQKAARPYGLYGTHGTNHELEGWSQGDPIQFTANGKTLIGEYRHLHINNHSPKGYVVIKYDGKIYERSVNSIEKPTKAAVKAAKAEPADKPAAAPKKAAAKAAPAKKVVVVKKK
jgi:hypothetical protein